MSLSGPVLDNRTYEQLKSELLRRLPVYAPEWTDHNESDPGIALLELFAYLGESLLYRFNQIPDATKVAFLNLLGAQPRPAQVARVMLAASTDRASGVPVLTGAGARAGAVEFETEDEVFVWPLQAVAVGKQPAALPTGLVGLTRTREERRRRDAEVRAREVLGATALPTGPTKYYRVQPVPADPLGTDEPLDVSSTVDTSLWWRSSGSGTSTPPASRAAPCFSGSPSTSGFPTTSTSGSRPSSRLHPGRRGFPRR